MLAMSCSESCICVVSISDDATRRSRAIVLDAQLKGEGIRVLGIGLLSTRKAKSIDTELIPADRGPALFSPNGRRSGDEKKPRIDSIDYRQIQKQHIMLSHHPSSLISM